MLNGISIMLVLLRVEDYLFIRLLSTHTHKNQEKRTQSLVMYFSITCLCAYVYSTKPKE